MHSGANGSPSRPGIRLVVGAVGIALVGLQLVPVLLGGRLPLPLRHAASELAELRLLADAGDAYRPTLLLLPGWIYLVVGAALAKAMPLWLVQRLLLGLAILGAPLLAERFARAIGRPYLGLLGAAAISASSVLYYGLTAHLLSLVPFWWGAWALVKQIDDPRAMRREVITVALLLCAGLSGPTFLVLAAGVVATARRGSWLRDLLPVVPAALILATGYASIGAHPEYIQPGDEWGFAWAGNWPILRDLRGQIFEGAAPASVRWLPVGLLAALLVLIVPSRRATTDAAAPHARVVRVLLAAALFFFFYLPRGASAPIRLEAITLRLITIWIPLLLLAGRPLAGWRRIAALPLVAVAVIAPLGARTQLAAITRPLGVYLLAEDATPKGRLCVVGAEQIGPQLSPLSIEGRTEGAELWGFVLGGGALPDTKRAVGPLAVTPVHPPTGPSASLLAERGVQSGESCDDYLIYRPPVMLDRDPTLQRRGDRVFWVHYRRIHPRQETP